MARTDNEASMLLAILGVAASSVATAMYADGSFQLWDSMLGVFVLSLVAAFWRDLPTKIAASVAISIISGGALLMIAGVFLEPFLIDLLSDQKVGEVIVTQTLNQVSRNNAMAMCWLFFSICVFVFRLFALDRE